MLQRVRTVALASAPLLMFLSTYALARSEAAIGRRDRSRKPQEPPPRTMFPRPFEGRYDLTLASAIISLVPFIVVTTA